MAIKATVFFRQNVGANAGRRPYGWSETTYLTTAANLDAAITDIKPLAVARLKMCGYGVSINGIRVSDSEIFRDSKIVGDDELPTLTLEQINLLNITTDAGTQVPIVSATAAQMNSAISDMCWSSYLFRVEGGTDYKSRASLWLSGLPDAAQAISENFPSGADFLAAYLRWKSLMTNNGQPGGKFGFRAFDNVPATNPSKAITGVSLGNPSVITCPGHGFVTGQTVKIRSVRGQPSSDKPPSGFFQITALDLNTFSIPWNGSAFHYFAGGLAIAKKYVVLPYTGIFPRGFRSKKRGAGSDLPRLSQSRR